ncbi:MAG: ABC transporter permease [Candidatus Limiplasma sp.]|nr:ABC transporter permease [Candidatus Limiplasma sp.]
MQSLKKQLKRFQKPLILLVVIAVMTILQPKVFLTWNNILSILYAISIYGVMICGMIFTILLGGIDLSVGPVAALSGAITVISMSAMGKTDGAVLAGVLLGLAAGALVGLLNGTIVSYFKVPAFLITLATQSIVNGLAQLTTGNKTIAAMDPPSFTFIGGAKLLGIPVPIFILALMMLLGYIVLNKTVFGQHVYAVGGNPQASSLSGVSVRKVSLLCYVISGLMAALAGIVLASMNQQAIAKAATGYENDVLTAIVVGGTSLMGGEGSIQGALFGAMLVGILNNGMRLMGVPSTYHTLVKGVIIIVAVAFDIYAINKNSGLARTHGHHRRLLAPQKGVNA